MICVNSEDNGKIIPKSWEFVAEAMSKVRVHKSGVEARVAFLQRTKSVRERANFAEWLLRAVSLIDLTTLAGDDTTANVQRLCIKASQPLSSSMHSKFSLEEGKESVVAPLTTAAVCVYPSKVQDATQLLEAMGVYGQIQVAAVATGFPTGLYFLPSRLQEITDAVSAGATEIDVVIDRSLVLTGQWQRLYDELVQMRTACGEARLKVILGVGELATYTNVYKASMVAMAAGADFIKTSTGKEAVNATLPIGLVMCRAIRHFYLSTGNKVGLKPAGGIKTCKDAVDWLILVKEELGDEWLAPELFRIGASSLLGVIEKWLHDYATGEVGDSARFNFI